MTFPITRRTLSGLALAALAARPSLAAEARTTLNVGTGGAFTSIDPHYHNLTPNNVIAYQLFDCLVYLDESYKPKPELALSWTAVSDTVWEWKLRPNVVFSDGTPFTADDVVATFERIPLVVNSPASFTQAIKPVARLEVVDPLTLRMHTKQPEPLLPIFLGQVNIISRKHGQGAVTADYNSGKAAIGTGPYTLESVLLGDKLVFKRNPKYWGTKPYFETVNYRLIANDAARTAAIQSGDVDIIDQVSTRDVATLRKDPKLVVEAPLGQRLIYLYLDSGRKNSPQVTDKDGKPMDRNPMQDVRVRRALSVAINREGLKNQIMDGFCVPTGQLMPKGAVGYSADIPVPKYDPAEAKKLLAAAGYPDGFSVVLAGPNNRYVNDQKLVEAIAQMWTRIGVKTSVDAKPAAMFFSESARDLYSADLQGWSSDTGEASSSLIQLVASVNPEKGRGAQPKPSHFAVDSIDAIIEKALATFDPASREKLYIDASKLAAEQVAFIPLHHQVNLYALRKGYEMRPRMQEGIRAYDVSYKG